MSRRVLRALPVGDQRFVAVVLSVALHALVLGWLTAYPHRGAQRQAAPVVEDTVLLLAWAPAAEPSTAPEPVLQAPAPATRAAAAPALQPAPAAAITPDRAPARPPAAMAAPPPPTEQEWAFAARYTLKNSKGYRHSWGQQVRSLMGTAVEGPDQGVVRFRIQIAPDGSMVRLDTVWTTSAVAEQRAREAIQKMPPLPPTPTGQPLVFERTISFSPFVSDVPPIYKDDCVPDPAAFHNPFAWGGRGQPPQGESAHAVDAADAADMARSMPQDECLKQLPQDSIEAEAADDQRQIRQWRSSTLGR